MYSEVNAIIGSPFPVNKIGQQKRGAFRALAADPKSRLALSCSLREGVSGERARLGDAEAGR
jgi:hypothetical protein